jgi:transcription termination factor Rho
MPSSHLTGKKKDDLATIAIVSGLLSQEQASAMTRPQLLKFLKQAETTAQSAALEKTKSTVAKAKPVSKPRKSAKPAAESSVTEDPAETPAPASDDVSGESASKGSAPLKRTRKGSARAATTASTATPPTPPPTESIDVEPDSQPMTFESTVPETGPVSLHPLAQVSSPKAPDQAPRSDSSFASGPVVRQATGPVAKSNRPVERTRPSQDNPNRTGHDRGAQPKSAGGRPPRTPNQPNSRPSPGQASGQARTGRNTGKPLPPGKRKSGSDRYSTGAPSMNDRPIRVKVFGIPQNPMAADDFEQEAGLARSVDLSENPSAAEMDTTKLTPYEQSAVQSNQAGEGLEPSLGTEQVPVQTGLAETPESGDTSTFSGLDAQVDDRTARRSVESGDMITGVLEVMPDGYGFLRRDNYLQGAKDAYVPPQYIRRFNLRPGDLVTGSCKKQRDNDRYQALLYIKEVNGEAPDKMIKRPHFDRLTPIYPDERYILETVRNELSTRIIDLVAPIGKGQRGMIVSPPKAGKTILLQKIANAISTNNPEVKLIVLLIDERPEEVTDMQRSINGEVVFSTFDKTPENHVKVTELVLERAMRLVELKQDVVILLDSMTRLARAYNLTITPTGRTLSGGLDPGALYGPKRFFGAARNIEHGGSLTIIATSLIETGSRMDEVIFEEFKGTGNMEVYLDRKLSEKRIFPAIDINRSGTRREELLLSGKELDAVWTIRKAFGQLDTAAVTETIINLLLKTSHNSQFISSINVSFNDKNVFDAMRGTRPGNSGNGNTGGG